MRLSTLLPNKVRGDVSAGAVAAKFVKARVSPLDLVNAFPEEEAPTIPPSAFLFVPKSCEAPGEDELAGRREGGK
jgi:hypothetical protein